VVRWPIMTKTQIASILIFLKEAGIQIDNAIQVATQAADEPTEEMLALILRDLSFEISRLELLHQR
jgi:hypothetical protein